MYVQWFTNKKYHDVVSFWLHIVTLLENLIDFEFVIPFLLLWIKCDELIIKNTQNWMSCNSIWYIETTQMDETKSSHERIQLRKKIWRVDRPFHDFRVWIAYVDIFSDVDITKKSLSTLTEFVLYTNLVKNDFTADATHRA